MRKTCRLVLLLAILLAAAACAPAQNSSIQVLATRVPDSSTPDPFISPYANNPSLAEYSLPYYYPETYDFIVSASKSEQGLKIYATTETDSWEKLIQAFNEHYPWIKVTIQELGSAQLFERYNAELKSYTPSADLIISADINGWQTFINSEQAANYISSEDAYTPRWLKPFPGVYAVSTDPLLIIYNNQWIRLPINRLREIKQAAAQNPLRFERRVISYDAENTAEGFYVNWFYTQFAGQTAWDNLKLIGDTKPKLMTSSREMVDMVENGDAFIGYFVPAIHIFPRTNSNSRMKWAYIQDGQPVVIRYTAIAKNATSPNSARLMLDFLLSQEGQLAILDSGLTPFRPDIIDVASYHLDKILLEIGSNNVIFMTFDPKLQVPETRAEFLAKWKESILRP